MMEKTGVNMISFARQMDRMRVPSAELEQQRTCT